MQFVNNKLIHMNIAKYSLDYPKVIYFFLVVMIIGGVLSFGSLGKKEDSPFVIKTAVLITQYPWCFSPGGGRVGY